MQHTKGLDKFNRWKKKILRLETKRGRNGNIHTHVSLLWGDRLKMAVHPVPLQGPTDNRGEREAFYFSEALGFWRRKSLNTHGKLKKTALRHFLFWCSFVPISMLCPCRFLMCYRASCMVNKPFQRRRAVNKKLEFCIVCCSIILKGKIRITGFTGSPLHLWHQWIIYSVATGTYGYHFDISK